MSEPRRCPFCGGRKFQRNTKAKGYFVKKQAEREKRDTSNHLIRCTGCGAKGPLKHSVGDAEAAWNVRHLVDDVTAELLSSLLHLRAFWKPGSNHDTDEVRLALLSADAAIAKALGKEEI